MNYTTLARKLGIHDVPIWIDYWPEKEIHRLATYEKAVHQLKENDPGTAIKAEIKALVTEQNARGKRYSDYLTRHSEDLAGTQMNPKPWTEIPKGAPLVWNLRTYKRYRELHFDYESSLRTTARALERRINIGRKLLQIEEVQAALIRRMGVVQLRRNIAVREHFCQFRLEAGQVEPTDEELYEAYAEMDIVRTYQFPPGRSIQRQEDPELLYDYEPPGWRE